MKTSVVETVWRLRRVLLLGALVVVLPGLGVWGLWEPVREGVEAVRGAEGLVLLGWWGLLVLVGGVLAAGALLPTHAVSLGMGYVFGLAGGLAGALGAVVIGTAGGWAAAKGEDRVGPRVTLFTLVGLDHAVAAPAHAVAGLLLTLRVAHRA
ncbi:MAG: hypothetical protein AAF797_14590 [Planctomycetota bacterium]